MRMKYSVRRKEERVWGRTSPTESNEVGWLSRKRAEARLLSWVFRRSLASSVQWWRQKTDCKCLELGEQWVQGATLSRWTECWDQSRKRNLLQKLYVDLWSYPDRLSSPFSLQLSVPHPTAFSWSFLSRNLSFPMLTMNICPLCKNLVFTSTHCPPVMFL